MSRYFANPKRGPLVVALVFFSLLIMYLKHIVFLPSTKKQSLNMSCVLWYVYNVLESR